MKIKLNDGRFYLETNGGNEPAYPQSDVKMHDGRYYECTSKGGLTKREYFAAMAMQGMLAANSDHKNTVEFSVIIADSLIEQLKKENE